MAAAPSPYEPIADEVPVADAVDQRRQIGEFRSLAEDIEPTEINEWAGEAAPMDAEPADWHEQHASAADDWDTDLDR